jgi:hypothetical protein
MPWFRVDDGFHAHPKANRASNAALGLWVRAGAYSANFLLDGHVDTALAERFGRPREIDGLVTAGLWIPCADGYIFHDWHDYQPSAEQVRAERAAARERQARRRRNERGQYE